MYDDWPMNELNSNISVPGLNHTMDDSRNGYSADAANWLRGLCMGAADIVPGVSGGTIALILGHYERLINALSHFDFKLLQLVKKRDFKQALDYCDFRFLVGLALGIATGMLALASLVHYLLDHQLPYTFAAFNGLIIASGVLVARRVQQWKAQHIALLVVGAFFAWQICLLQPMNSELTPLNAFLAATVAICAMILPGISGAFILLLLGLYQPVTALIKGLPKGDVTLDGLVIIGCFGAGCAIGLLAFSRLLKWLLAHRHDTTMACLVGLMIGSLYRIWPFQIATEETASLEFKERNYIYQLPSESGASLIVVLIVAALAAGCVLLMDKVGNRMHRQSAESSESP